METPSIVFNNKNAEIIRTHNMNLNDWMSITRASQILELQDVQEVKDALAQFIAGVVEKKTNEKFHQSLTTLEKKYNILSAESVIKHEQRVKTNKAIATGTFLLIFDAVPIVYDFVSDYFSKANISEFIIGWTSYINGKYDASTAGLVKGFIRDLGITMKEDDYKRFFEKYANASQLEMSTLQLSGRSRSLISENLRITAKKIVSFCDLSDDSVYERALEFVAECLAVRFNEAEEVINDSKAAQEFTSSIVEFSAASYLTYFRSIIKSVNTARQFAYCDLENDPYGKLRNERYERITKVVDADALTAMSQFSPTAAKIYATVGLMRDSLNIDGDMAIRFGIQKIKKLMMTELI